MQSIVLNGYKVIITFFPTVYRYNNQYSLRIIISSRQYQLIDTNFRCSHFLKIVQMSSYNNLPAMFAHLAPPPPPPPTHTHTTTTHLLYRMRQRRASLCLNLLQKLDGTNQSNTFGKEWKLCKLQHVSPVTF